MFDADMLQNAIVGASGMLGSGGLIFYYIKRKLTNDSNIDELEKKNQIFIDNLNKQLEDGRVENTKLREAMDRVGDERNEAVKDLGLLQGEVKSLETQVNLLTVQVGKLEEENRRLTLEIRLMHNQMMACFAKMDIEPTPIPETPKFVPRFIGDKE